MWHAGSNALTSLFCFLMALFERIYTTYQVQLVHIMGTRQSVQMTFCQITLEHTVIS